MLPKLPASEVLLGNAAEDQFPGPYFLVQPPCA